jgi:hypothetical protein
LHFWFVAYFSLRRGKRSAVSKSMLAVWKLKAPGNRIRGLQGAVG